MKQTITVTTDSFKQEVLRAQQPVLVDFWTDWCGPCRRLAPIIDEIAEENQGIKVCKVNAEENPQLAGLYHVSAVPTLMLFQDGTVQAKCSGAREKQEVLEQLGIVNGGIS